MHHSRNRILTAMLTCWYVDIIMLICWHHNVAILTSLCWDVDKWQVITNAEARGPCQDPVCRDLHHHEHWDYDPVLQPPEVILWGLAQHCLANVSTNAQCMLQTPVLSYLDAHVARVDAHHKTDEEITTIASHQAEQHQAQQTWDGSRVTQCCPTVWPQTCYTIRWDLHLMKLSWDGSLVSLVSTITLWAIFR